MAQSECLLSSSSSSSSTQQQHHQQQPPQQQLHIPKQEPSEFIYDYQPVLDKRASWAPGSSSGSSSHTHHHKRSQQDVLTNYGSMAQAQAPPPVAHAKNTPTSVSAWPAPIYRQAHQSNTPLGGSPGGILPQEIYAQGELYRRPTVFVSQAPYQPYHRIVPPPAHNASNRQVSGELSESDFEPSLKLCFSLINRSCQRNRYQRIYHFPRNTATLVHLVPPKWPLNTDHILPTYGFKIK